MGRKLRKTAGQMEETEAESLRKKCEIRMWLLVKNVQRNQGRRMTKTRHETNKVE